MANILPGSRDDEFKATRSIGNLGEITFECSSEVFRTIKNYRREVKARYAEHKLIMKTPALEFLGADTGEISFKMIFSASLGVNPREESARLQKMCQEGQAVPLVLGSEVIGELWVVESVNESATAFDGRGNIILSEVDVRLKEYSNGV